MNTFILFHKGVKLPEHILCCIKQIEKTQTEYKIFLLTNIKIKNTGNVEIIPLDSFNFVKLDNLDYYINDSDPLWRTSLERIFYLNEFCKKFNVYDAIHFDNDVLIYHDVNLIIEKLRNNVKNVGITKHKLDEYVCGFMYIKTPNGLNDVCNHLFELAKLGVKKLENLLGSMPHEMRLLGYINSEHGLITSLPGLPDSENVYDFVFDPSTFGQFLGGSGGCSKNSIHPSNINRIIDKKIVSGEILPYFDLDLKMPYILYNEKKIPIFNLHVHSKQLNDFKSF